MVAQKDQVGSVDEGVGQEASDQRAGKSEKNAKPCSGNGRPANPDPAARPAKLVSEAKQKASGHNAKPRDKQRPKQQLLAGARKNREEQDGA